MTERNAYDNDGINNQQEIELTIRAAVLNKSVCKLIGCQSKLVAKLAFKEILEHMKVLHEWLDKVTP